MRICVIGAGVVGVTTAWTLANRGWQVTLVDSHSDPAQAASYANGGQLSYSYVAPLAGPGVLPNVPKWLWSKRSPLRFHLRMDPQQWRWCAAFIASCRGSVARYSTASLLDLAYLSRTSLQHLLDETCLEFNHARNGKLIVYRSPQLLDKATKLVEYQSTLGARQLVLSAAETVRREPALRPIEHKLAGAIYTPSEESGDCRLFTHNLFACIRSLPNVEVRMNTSIQALHGSRGAVTHATDSRGERIAADHFVVAAGLGSRGLLRPLGVNPLLYPLKGYSLDVETQAGVAPGISVTDYERRTVYATLGSSLRVAAMVGIGMNGGNVESDRIGLVKEQAAELFPRLDFSKARAWAGNRPATPHGRPIIGPAPRYDNLWMNIGHGALGFTLACGSSHLLGAQMAGENLPIDASPFLYGHAG
ncbi:D-amino acid dehydrogenase [Pusillimonas noertemannii]|uniref:D-amino acid dehydrogenase n=1 Tax=Pusillimonas noertemannii TaxID=305977 RepID=UPI000474E415|nr:D-amino acid dehydrogenase [Pusillimonas noertemannii]